MEEHPHHTTRIPPHKPLLSSSFQTIGTPNPRISRDESPDWQASSRAPNDGVISQDRRHPHSSEDPS